MLTDIQKAAAMARYGPAVHLIVKKSLAAAHSSSLRRPVRKSANGDVTVTQDQDDKRRFSITKLLKGATFGEWDGADRERQHFEKRHIFHKALNEGSDVAGGYLVPEETTGEVIELLKAEAIARRVGMRIVPMSRSVLNIRKLASASTTSWGAEQTTLAEQTAPTFGRVQLVARKLFCRLPISSELLMDSTPAADDIVFQDIAEQMALAEDQAYFLGDGIGDTPLGLLNAVGVNAVGGVTTANLTETQLRAMNLAVLESNATPTAWVMTPALWDTIQQFQTSVTTTGGGTRLVQQDLNGSGRMTLLGYPVFVNTAILSGTDEYIFLGKWNEALIGQRMSLEFKTSEHILFNSDEVMIRAIMRVDFALRQPAAFARITIDNT